MPEISQLFIYPVKSLGGIELSSSLVTERGLQYDRRWMLVDRQNRFISQREFPPLSLLKAELDEAGLRISHKQAKDSIMVPFTPEPGLTFMVQVWGEHCLARGVSREVDAWLSQQLSLYCRLVYMPDESRRRVDPRYAHRQEITSFSDGYPFLLIGQASLDDLNNRLEELIPINRFRPNIVVTGSDAFAEDQWAHFTIGNIDFFGVKLCARCIVTTIDQERGLKGKEPLRTLSTFRMMDNAVFFGQNLLHKGIGTISIGDKLEIHEQKVLVRY